MPTQNKRPFPRLGFAGLVSLVTYRYALTFLQFGALGLFIAGNYAFTHLQINTSTDDMLSPELDFRQAHIAMKASLPARGDDIILVVEGPSSTIAHDAANKVVDKIMQYPALFDHVFSTSTDKFFSHNALLYLEGDQVEDITDSMLEAQPLLTVLYNDPTLRGLFNSFDLTLSSLEERVIPITETPLIDKVFGAMGESIHNFERDKNAYISWREHILGRSEDRDERRVIVALKPTLDYNSLRPAQKAITTLQTISQGIASQYGETVSIGLTGSIMLEEEEMEAAVFGASLAGAIAFFLVGWLVVRGLGNWRLFIATMLTLFLGLIETAAFAAWSVGRLNIISVAFAVLFIGIGVDFCIQFCLSFRESLRKTHNAEHAIIIAARKLSIPLLLAALAGVSGFLSFVPTSYIGLSELGIIAAGGLAIALINGFTLLPALIRILTPTYGWKKSISSQKTNYFGFPLLTPIIIQHDFRIISLAALFSLASLTAFSNYHFDSDPFNLRDPNAPSMVLAKDLIRNGNSEAYAATILASSPVEAQILAIKMEKQDEVSHAKTPATFLPRNVQPKLEAIQETALVLIPSLTYAEQPDQESDEGRLKSAISFRDHLASFLKTQDKSVWLGARKLLKKLERIFPDDENSLVFLKDYAPIATTGLPRAIELIDDSLQPDERLVYKNLAYLPDSIKARYIDPHGRSTVTVYPHPSATYDNQKLANFTDNVRALVPYATGGSVLMVEGGRTVIQAFKEAGLLAVLCVFLILLASLRSISNTLMVFMPLTIAAIITIGLSVAIHVPLNYANLIALPLLFSLGVSYGIYLVWRWRTVHRVEVLMNTATPRAILYSALTSIASFGSLIVSSHRGASSMGIMLLIALSLAILASLVLLPALMSVSDRWQIIRRHEEKRSFYQSLRLLLSPPQSNTP